MVESGKPGRTTRPSPGSSGGRERRAATADDSLVRMLALRDLSVAEARSRLESAGFPADKTEAALAAAIGRRHLDDRRLAESLVRKAFSREPQPALELVEALLAGRAIPEDVRRWALEGAPPVDRIEGELVEYLRRAGRTSPRTLYSRLVRAGHSPERVLELLGRAGLAPEDGG